MRMGMIVNVTMRMIVLGIVLTLMLMRMNVNMAVRMVMHFFWSTDGHRVIGLGAAASITHQYRSPVRR